MNDYLLEIVEIFNTIDTLIEELPKLKIDSKMKENIKENLECASFDIFKIMGSLYKARKKRLDKFNWN